MGSRSVQNLLTYENLSLFGLTKTQLTTVLGVDVNVVNKMEITAEFDPTSSQGETTKLLILLYQILSTQMSADPEWIHNFMNSYNNISGDIPTH